MADLVLTATNVLPRDGASLTNGTAGATVTAGQIVYLDVVDSKYKLADADSATVAARSPSGIALNGASNGQPLRVLNSGPVTIGATLTPGLVYYASKVAGGICPVADVTTGAYPTIIGIATSSTILDVKIHESGVAV